MDSVRDLLSTRRPLFTTWTFGRRRYYSPLVHAMAARMDHAATAAGGETADPAFPPVAEARQPGGGDGVPEVDPFVLVAH